MTPTTAGRISTGGDFAWTGKVDLFDPSGTHEVVFNGASAQHITNIVSGGRVYAFHELRIAAGASVTMDENITVDGDLVVDGTLTVPDDKILTVTGTITGLANIVTVGTGKIIVG